MGQAGNYDELEFELALTGVLEDIYDLKVRTDRDLLNRRRNGYSTLDFQYQHDGLSNGVKVVISIQGVPDCSYVLHADFTDADTIAESAESCEELALALREYQDSQEPPEHDRRRWDD